MTIIMTMFISFLITLMTTGTDFLTIKEAADRYAKAEITIRRFVRNVVQENDKADREMVMPTTTEVQKLKKQSKPFSYKINGALLEKYFGENSQKADAQNKKGKKGTESNVEFVNLLRKTNDGLLEQLSVKDQQIRALNQSLDELTERQRETNILMKGFQEQFLLGAAKPEKKKWWRLKA